jgi:hypothetical protein
MFHNDKTQISTQKEVLHWKSQLHIHATKELLSITKPEPLDASLKNPVCTLTNLHLESQ